MPDLRVKVESPFDRTTNIAKDLGTETETSVDKLENHDEPIEKRSVCCKFSDCEDNSTIESMNQMIGVADVLCWHW